MPCWPTHMGSKVDCRRRTSCIVGFISSPPSGSLTVVCDQIAPISWIRSPACTYDCSATSTSAHVRPSCSLPAEHLLYIHLYGSPALVGPLRWAALANLARYGSLRRLCGASHLQVGVQNPRPLCLRARRRCSWKWSCHAKPEFLRLCFGR